MADYFPQSPQNPSFKFPFIRTYTDVKYIQGLILGSRQLI